jgi:hypothetical protein
MWEQTSGQKTRKRRSKISFESTATISFDKGYSNLLSFYADPHNINHDAFGCLYYNCDGNCYKSPTHPLIDAGKKPYRWGNGGLLNPELKEYSVTSVIVEDGVQVTLRGIVEADGFAPQAFNETYIGQSNNTDKTYEPEKLEELILGALTERSIDRRMSDLIDTDFDRGNNQERFEECVRQEWFSSSGYNMIASRDHKCTELIGRYCPRTIYWHSSRLHPTIGIMESHRLSKNFGTDVQIKINTFKVHVSDAK